MNQLINQVIQAHNCHHVAIIMDGNGRWAQKRGKTRSFGHRAGIKSIRRAISFAVKHNIDALTLYAFSSENWSRPADEVNTLMKLFIWALDNEIENLHHNNIRLRIIGDIKRFNTYLRKSIHKAEELTNKNTGLMLNIAANYGGRWDIIQSVKNLAIQVQEGSLKPEQINENILTKYICMNELAPVDLVIRTGGEHRISNFLLWQIAYAELYFTDVLWPDFNELDFKKALNTFANRKRRFGNVTFYNDEVQQRFQEDYFC